MSTLLEIKTGAANYLGISVNDLTQNGQDLFLLAANEVVTMAELVNDFEFSRKTITVTVNGLTGGNLALARDLSNNLVEVKTVIEVGLLDTMGNLCPVEWTTVSESLTRQREDNTYAWPRYPTDSISRDTPFGGARFNFSGDAISKWPRLTETDTTDYILYLEGYTFHTDWFASDLAIDGATVTGTLTPNATGLYHNVGTSVNGRSVYLRSGTSPYLIFSSGGVWDIISMPDVAATWESATHTSPATTYPPVVNATGTATVTLTTGTSDIWTTHGQKYLLWATLVQLNHIWRRWVPRQEGNLPPPAQLAEEGLQSLIAWDAYRFEGFRTHNR